MEKAARQNVDAAFFIAGIIRIETCPAKAYKSFMIPEIGHFCLILAFLMSGAQAFLIPAEIRARCAKLIFALLATSFFSLMWCYVTSDFTVANVANNSHTLKPMIYKISGVWSNHEGSMLLWVLILALFGLIMANDRKIEKTLQADALRIQGFLAFGFLSFILFTSNPFERLSLPPVDGAGLNPVLQDIGLAVHPPLLYTGYVGFSAVFSLALAALLSGQMDRNWGRIARSYTLCAWMALSGGIALGSWWAYYELGWGGWWFWDPVENASLMPWLLGTALLHSVLVLEKRGGLKKWTVLLAILTFSLSMLGTFLVRSGVLTSVHAFASDPARGIFILCLLSVFTGSALLAFALRASTLDSPDMRFSPLSRESSMVFNNLFMVTACATVLIGTLYPLLLDALDMGAISVGAPYFNTALVPLMLPALFLMGLAPYLAWKKASFKALFPRLQTPALLTISGIVLIIVFTAQKNVLVFVILLATIWLLFTTLYEWFLASHMGKRVFSLPLEHHGMSLAHLGMAIAVFGMAGSTLWLEENIRVMKPGQSMDIGRYTLHFESVSSDFGENYVADTAHFGVTKFSASQRITTLAAQRRYYPVAAQTTTEAAIYTSWSDDLYVAIGENQKDGKTEWIVRAYTHPLIPCLWTGFILIASGGLISFIGTQRRKHTGASQT